MIKLYHLYRLSVLKGKGSLLGRAREPVETRRAMGEVTEEEPSMTCKCENNQLLCMLLDKLIYNEK